MNIRNESVADVPVIEVLIESAFREAPHTSHTEQFIVNALRKADKLSVSLVAEVNDKIVGQVAVSPVSISDCSEGWYGLGPISVLPEHRNQGIGSKLMEAAMTELQQLGASGCVVLGKPGYYGRFGFEVMPSLVLPGIPPEYFQVLPFGTKTPKGEVTYHEAFNVQS